MKNKEKKNGVYLIILFLIFPIIFLYFIQYKYIIPFSFENIIVTLGELFGLIGIVMFSINLILSARFSFINKLFHGLSDIYKKHNILGQIAFILLLFHPILLLPRYTPSLLDAFSFLFIGDSLAINLGIVSIWLMIILIILTLFLKPKYNIWKITHKFFGLALFLGALHVYLIPSFIMDNVLLKSYILGFGIIGILAFLYQSIFKKYFTRNYKYIVDNVIHLSEKVIEINMKPYDKKINFNAGQFIFISFKQKGLSEVHPFSISSSPDDELLTITVKNLGDFTKKLINELNNGTIAMVEGPYGIFSYNIINNEKQIWIAGGIGVTPFVSFAKDLVKKKTKGLKITLFYCVKNKEESVYLTLLKDLENKIDGFFVIPFYSRINGHINSSKIKQNINNLSDNDFFICAPPTMIQSLRVDLEDNNIHRLRIHSEEFNF